MQPKFMLSSLQKKNFYENGFVLIKNFFNLDTQITPIQRAIYEVIGLVIKRHNINLSRESFSGDNFDSGYQDLIAINRSYGSEVYDLVRQIPSFIRLISSSESEKLFCDLRMTDLPGIGTASYGIRIDNPFEDQFRSQWHQEFLSQPQSLDGIVFWTPLLRVTDEMGPVIICSKSHKDGLCMYTKSKEYAHKIGAYKNGIKNEDSVVAKYEKIAPLTSPGDVILIDFLTIHQSGINVSARSRWSIQYRFFNYKEKTGMRIGWKASVTAGTDIEKIFSNNFTE